MAREACTAESGQIVPIGAAQAIEAGQQDAPLSILEFSHVIPVGTPDLAQARLVEQGQATTADEAMSSEARFAHQFSAWRPRTKAEQDMALEGLLNRVNRLASIPGGFDYVAAAVEAANGYVDKAQIDLEALDVLGGHEHEFNSQIEAVGIIRQSEETMSTLARLRLEAQMFEAGKRLVTNRGPYDTALAKIREELDQLSDSNLLFMWRSAMQGVGAESDYWGGQLLAAKQNSMVEMIAREAWQHSRS